MTKPCASARRTDSTVSVLPDRLKYMSSANPMGVRQETMAVPGSGASRQEIKFPGVLSGISGPVSPLAADPLQAASKRQARPAAAR
jgi:hypothetical protein